MNAHNMYFFYVNAYIYNNNSQRFIALRCSGPVGLAHGVTKKIMTTKISINLIYTSKILIQITRSKHDSNKLLKLYQDWLSRFTRNLPKIRQNLLYKMDISLQNQGQSCKEDALLQHQKFNYPSWAPKQHKLPNRVSP